MWPLKVGRRKGFEGVVSMVTLNLLCPAAAFEDSLQAEEGIGMGTCSQAVDKAGLAPAEIQCGLNDFSGGFCC